MYSIGQLAKKAQVSNRTLRYYEELGLIQPLSRGENRYRYYDESHIQRLNTIRMLQESGFALKEIVAALSPILDPHGNTTFSGQQMAKEIYAALSAQREKLLERQKEVAETVAELQKTMQSLVDCFGCKVSSSPEDCLRCEKGPMEVKNLGLRFKSEGSGGDGHALTQTERAAFADSLPKIPQKAS